MNHPLHPLLVHIPVGLWVVSFVSDIVFLASGNPNFAVFSYYLILFGLFGAALAVPTGFAEYLELPSGSRAHRIATTHMTLNGVVAVLFLIDFFTRRGLQNGAPDTVTIGEFILTVIAIGLLAISGYLGGLLVYDYGAGFKPQLRGKENEPRIRRVA
jgi:uncharacterized membrane protein